MLKGSGAVGAVGVGATAGEGAEERTNGVAPGFAGEETFQCVVFGMTRCHYLS